MEQRNCNNRVVTPLRGSAALPQLKEEKTYWPDGKLKTQEFYKNGKLEGVRKVWNEIGQLGIEESYKNGKLEGERTWHRDNGYLYLQETYKNGVLEEERKVWYEHGQMWVQEFYKNGKLEGEKKEYTYGGNSYRTFWRGGIEITKKEYYDEILSLLDNKLEEPLRGSPAPRELHLKDIIFSYL